MSGVQEPRLVLVAAIARNGVIGRENGLAWRLRTDMRRFKALTWGKPLVIGRRTWDSIGGPLPGRETVVLTRDPAFAAAGAHRAGDWAEAKSRAAALAAALGTDTAMVAGGAEIYRLALPDVEALRLTLVEARPAGDAFFPDLDLLAFRETAREEHPAGPGDEHAFAFVDLVRDVAATPAPRPRSPQGR